MPLSPASPISAGLLSHTPTLLIADDDRTMLMMLKHSLQGYGYSVRPARSGEEALEILAREADAIDAMVLDREMPGISGLGVVSCMKEKPEMAAVPVIMLTGSGQQEKIQEGIDAGVFYYLVKPTEHFTLRGIIGSAVRERQQKRALIREVARYGTAFKAMDMCRLSVRTPAEAEDAACFLASCFPQPERVVTGLLELIVNAVEHGNLGITYEEKAALLAGGSWREEIERRLESPEAQGKTAEVIYQKQQEGWLVQVTDQGQGFDWRQFLTLTPARATAAHGRGIPRARLLSFDRLSYNDSGNQVTAMVAAAPG